MTRYDTPEAASKVVPCSPDVGAQRRPGALGVDAVSARRVAHRVPTDPFAAVDEVLGRACRELKGRGTRHDSTLSNVAAITRLGAQGYPGAHQALAVLRDRFITAIADRAARPEAEREWARMADGAADLIASTPARIPRWADRAGPGVVGGFEPFTGVNGGAAAIGGGTNFITDAMGDSWMPTDTAATLADLLAGRITAPTPTVLLRTDRQGLFYRGKVNGIAGASGDGKSLIALYACVQELNAGRAVPYIDFEDDAPSVISRLLALGATPDAIAKLFVYLSPDEPYGPEAQLHLEGIVRDRDPSLVVIDSTGESLAIEGAKPNDDDDVARWFRRLPTAIARLGPAVVVIDHMTKADDGSLSPIGSQRKRAAIGGAQYVTKLAKAFSRDAEGMVTLTCGKDRNGAFRRGQVAAEITVTPHDGTITLTVAEPASGVGASFRPTHLMERVSRHVERSAGPLTRNTVLREVKGNQDGLVQALSLLVEEGYVSRTKSGQSHHHEHVKAYREDMG